MEERIIREVKHFGAGVRRITALPAYEFLISLLGKSITGKGKAPTDLTKHGTPLRMTQIAQQISQDGLKTYIELGDLLNSKNAEMAGSEE